MPGKSRFPPEEKERWMRKRRACGRECLGVIRRVEAGVQLIQKGSIEKTYVVYRHLARFHSLGG